MSNAISSNKTMLIAISLPLEVTHALRSVITELLVGLKEGLKPDARSTSNSVIIFSTSRKDDEE